MTGDILIVLGVILIILGMYMMYMVIFPSNKWPRTKCCIAECKKQKPLGQRFCSLHRGDMDIDNPWIP